MEERLLNAILAMDSYNRGYVSGVNIDVAGPDGTFNPTLGGTQLGQYTIINATASNYKDDGFYAIAYQNGDQIIISYRGTDNFFDDPTAGGGDILNGYDSGGGFAETAQSKDAIKFYNDVAAMALPGTTISITGHSMGGGLAGLVAAIEGKQAIVFDSMAFSGAVGHA